MKFKVTFKLFVTFSSPASPSVSGLLHILSFVLKLFGLGFKALRETNSFLKAA